MNFDDKNGKLRSLFGGRGLATGPEAESGVFLLKTTSPEHLPQLRASLTLLTRLQRRRCRMDVLAVAPRQELRMFLWFLG